jgi:hypothetical protein
MTGITVYAAEQPTWSSFADNVMGYVNIRSKIDFSAQPASLFILLRKNGLHTYGETFDFNAKQENTSVIFDVQNYPGWTAHLLKSRTNEIIRDLPIDIDPPDGRIKVTLPQGEYGLMLRFEDTAPRVLGQILSALSVLIAIVIFSWDVWRRGRNDRIYRNLNSNFPTA